MEVPEVSQSEEGQKQKLRVVVQVANQILGQGQSAQSYHQMKWTPEAIHNRVITFK